MATTLLNKYIIIWMTTLYEQFSIVAYKQNFLSMTLGDERVLFLLKNEMCFISFTDNEAAPVADFTS